MCYIQESTVFWLDIKENHKRTNLSTVSRLDKSKSVRTFTLVKAGTKGLKTNFLIFFRSPAP